LSKSQDKLVEGQLFSARETGFVKIEKNIKEYGQQRKSKLEARTVT
jgi:hypothetical protein